MFVATGTMSTVSRFLDLPRALRLRIWTSCLPHRFVELDYPIADHIFPSPLPCTHFSHTTHINSQPPLITQVCREARQVAFDAGTPFEDISHPGRPDEAWFSSGTSLRASWLDRTRDAVHMHWTAALEPLYDSDGDAISSLAWDAKFCTGVASLRVEFFEENYHEAGSVDVPAALPEELKSLVDNPLNARLAKQPQNLLSLPMWMVVMDTVVVHLSREAAAERGFFALLGDATVQIIDVVEQEVLHGYYDAAGLVERLQVPHGVQSGGHKFELISKIREDLDGDVQIVYARL
nr:hypothetical protein B0A51_07226 [Rachicladosporium sp. CCFEE 5018]OQO23573.1 hypothetical protein B0A51_07470 [Rachicladosporium sp. CCFEE 5018]